MRKLIFTALATAAMVAAAPASATTACASTDISPAAQACQGFFAGNLLNQSNFAAQQTALSALGYSLTGSFSDIPAGNILTGLNGQQTIDFASLLYGITYIGVHYGNGVGSPGYAPKGKADGDDTAFYRFDAGTTGLDTFMLNFKASSNVVLYSTGTPTPGVPEPGTWAMMLLGFGAVGGALSRSKRKNALQVA